MKGVGERKPAVGPLRLNARLESPVARPVRFLDLLLHEMKSLQLRAGQRIQRQDQTGVFFNFFPADDQAAARATRQQWDLRVDSQRLQHLLRVREKFRRRENQPQRNLWRAQLSA